jgi:hypothetical protein
MLANRQNMRQIADICDRSIEEADPTWLKIEVLIVCTKSVVHILLMHCYDVEYLCMYIHIIKKNLAFKIDTKSYIQTQSCEWRFLKMFVGFPE